MILKLNGRELTSAPPQFTCDEIKAYTMTNCLKGMTHMLLEAVKKAINDLRFSTMVFIGAAIPADNLTQRLWPLIGRMQDFGLFIGIAFGLWGVYMIMVGNPEGKQKLIQALIGFVGLYIVPEAFLAIRDAFRVVR